MTYTALTIKERSLTLPDEWIKTLNTDQVAAGMLGDVLVIRPIPTVAYTPDAEQQALEAVRQFDEAKKSGDVFEINNKTFNDLKQMAKSLK